MGKLWQGFKQMVVQNKALSAVSGGALLTGGFVAANSWSRESWLQEKVQAMQDQALRDQARRRRRKRRRQIYEEWLPRMVGAAWITTTIGGYFLGRRHGKRSEIKRRMKDISRMQQQQHQHALQHHQQQWSIVAIPRKLVYALNPFSHPHHPHSNNNNSLSASTSAASQHHQPQQEQHR
ncbi:hypothetical protein QOT17_005690 [Balamuthia mandrillaris]